MSWLHIILDAGHGSDTPGKRSPIRADGKRLYEWESNRKIVNKIAQKLDRKGVSYDILVPENKDVRLPLRVMRANHIALKHGVKNCLLVSVHSNAGGGTGFEFFTSPGKTMSDDYAEIFAEEAVPIGFPIRKDLTDGDIDKEGVFTIICGTLSPAIITENLFMDNDKDLDFLLSEEGVEAIAEYHFKAIMRCVDHHKAIMSL
uniref:N-acetylmuramoyl-L-alanine amidase n=1 Tax=Alistipes sp. TaxID=1872444 RepID=UPI0040562726